MGANRDVSLVNINFDSITDEVIQALIEAPKFIKNPNAKLKENRGSLQANYRIELNSHEMRLYVRQNTFDIDNFSCGLSIFKPDGNHLTLLRYNGSNHIHEHIEYKCHIHKASHKAIMLGKKPESFADETNQYTTLGGALYWICKDANITGLKNLSPDQPRLI